MAQIKNLTFNDNGYIEMPVGTVTQRPSSPNAGMLRYNIDIECFEYYDDQSNRWRFIADNELRANGGIIVDCTIQNTPYRFHVFPYPGSYVMSISQAGTADILIVGGGGGGGNGYYAGGGGGGGVVFLKDYQLQENNYNIVVGAGGAEQTTNGARGNPGQNSQFGSIVALGGGEGAGRSDSNGGSGGSGGGAARPNESGGQSLQSQQTALTFSLGNNGGSTASSAYGAAGGGAGDIGDNGPSDSIFGTRTTAGVFLGNYFPFLGDNGWFAGGGGGGTRDIETVQNRPGGGGIGGESSNHGNPGRNSMPGKNTTGAGGGGGGDDGPFDLGSKGGNGIVVIRYKKSDFDNSVQDRIVNANQIGCFADVRQDLILDLDANSPASYPGQGNIWYDLSGHEHHGTIGSGIIFSENPPKFEFPGTVTEVDLGAPNTLQINDKPVSVSVWLKILSPNDTNYRAFFGTGSGNRNYNCYVRGNGSNRWQIHMSAGGSGSLSPYSLERDVWYHVVCIFDIENEQHIVYINGDRFFASSESGTSLPSSVEYKVGSADNEFQGYISSMQIYQKRLSDREVEQNFISKYWRHGVRWLP